MQVTELRVEHLGALVEQRQSELESSIGVRPMPDVYDAIDPLLARVSEPGELVEGELVARPAARGARRR